MDSYETPRAAAVPNFIQDSRPCAGCGCDLRGVAVGSACPQCGQPVEAVAPSTQPIEMDVHCMTCGYNLRGLTTAGQCPECGAAVARSVHGNLLRFSDPNWLRKLLLGVRLALWIIVAVIVMFLVSISAVLLVSVAPIKATFVIMSLNLISWVVITGLGLGSLFLITSQEPRTALTEDPVTLRKVLRTLAVVSAASGGVQYVLPAISPTTAQMVAIAMSPVSLLWIVSYFGWFVYMRRFARRIPNPGLEKSTTRFMWTSGIVAVLGVGFSITMIIFTFVAPTALGLPTTLPTGPAATTQSFAMTATGPAGVSGGANVTVTTPGGTTAVPNASMMFIAGLGIVATCIGFPLGIVIIIWYIRLLFQYRDNFRRALEDAELLFAASDMQTPQRFD